MKTPVAPGLISERIWLSDQSWRFERIFRLQGLQDQCLRVDIRHNAYDYQSFARIELWDGTMWRVIHTIPGEALKLYPYVRREPPKVEEVFEKDVQELVRVARAVLD